MLYKGMEARRTKNGNIVIQDGCNQIIISHDRKPVTDDELKSMMDKVIKFRLSK